jgi:GNAT superfamily N-acetyltransferase
MKLVIRKATPEESDELTDISFASKRFWNYPENYFEIWRNELTITPEYIRENIVNVAECGGEILGYYSIVKIENDFLAGKVLVSKGYWLEHIFIKPNFIGRGIGSELIRHVRKTCKKLEVKKVFVFSDPNAKGFYDKIRAEYIKESPSSIEGRTVSLFQLKV